MFRSFLKHGGTILKSILAQILFHIFAKIYFLLHLICKFQIKEFQWHL